jgi:molybdopterin adenylyltransferase
MTYKAGIITVSDKGSVGEREDKSGPALREVLRDAYDVAEMVIVPDEVELISGAIVKMVDESGMDLVVTTGGTGLTKRDVTPEATRAVIHRDLPGFAEIMRSESYKITPHGIISRGVSGIRNESIIINLPGSPRAAVECLGFVLMAIPHALAKVKNDPADCASS